MNQVHEAAERAARDGYGRLVAFLCERCRDLAAVEDALSQAFLEALRQWPDSGIPAAPEAWLLIVARRRLIDQSRNRNTQAISFDLLDLAEATTATEQTIPDERLKLLFVCTHPAIDPIAQTPLMLQVVLGFDAATIAKAFVVSPTTMSQRLVRAKTRIRDLGIPFIVPELDELPQRIESVLAAIYAVYGSAWEDLSDAESSPKSLVREALHLARMLATLLPDEPEPRGLLALILHAEARRPARVNSQNEYIPLLQQNCELWNRAMMIEAEQHLWVAASKRKIGRFQLEAAIQSAHNRRAFDGVIPTEDILALYRQLVQIHNTLGAWVGYAAALGNANQPENACKVLDSLAATEIEAYQPYWAVRSHVMKQLKQVSEAEKSKQKAIELANDPAIREYLQKQAARDEGDAFNPSKS